MASFRIVTCSKSMTSCRARSVVSLRRLTPAVAAFPTSQRSDAGPHTTITVEATIF
jgi:hypothetical protein